MKKTEDIKNSTEEDQEDEDSCTKRRVRGTSPLSLILIFLPQKIQRNSETRKSKRKIKVRCPTPIPQVKLPRGSNMNNIFLYRIQNQTQK